MHGPSPQIPWPHSPAGWHYFCSSNALQTRPVALTVGERRIVVFRDSTGKPAALDSRCCHLGANLGEGTVHSGRIRCGLHGWEFGPDGLCTHIPCSQQIPLFARQPTYPIAEVAGHIFVFNRRQALYPMPFFDNAAPTDLVGAPAYRIAVNTAWPLVSANAFDVQHFSCAHERRLLGPVRVEDRGPFARHLSAEFAVSGTSWRDRLTRRTSGDRLTLSITVWGGLLMFVEARFRRTTTFGLLCLLPVGDARTEAVNIIFVRRSTGIRRPLDPIDARIRSSFIRAFLGADVRLLEGLRYTPGTLIDADATMRDYLEWLAHAASDTPHSPSLDAPHTQESSCECASTPS
jgi:nitrite reductase/ring-hydroxylating ferredoxin subunit